MRSRLYMEHECKGGNETGVICLTTKKSNYGPRDNVVRMRWEDGVFIEDDGNPSAAQALLDAQADKQFLAILSKLIRQGQKVSPNVSQSYAPKLIAEHPDGKGFDKKQMAAAMQRLLDKELIKIDEDGPPSRRYKRLVVASEIPF